MAKNKWVRTRLAQNRKILADGIDKKCKRNGSNMYTTYTTTGICIERGGRKPGAAMGEFEWEELEGEVL